MRITRSRRSVVPAAGADGTLVLTSMRRICSTDAAADRILSRADALAAVDGRLVAVRASDDRRLQATFDALTAHAPVPAQSSCCAMPVARSGGGVDYVLLLHRAEPEYTAATCDAARPESRIVVVIHAFEPRPAMPVGLLEASLGLTAAEARLAARISGGCSPRQAAVDLGVSLSTVRTHLRAIYRKTGTAGQVDLAWRVAALWGAASAATVAEIPDEPAVAGASSTWTRRRNSHLPPRPARLRSLPGSLTQ